MRIEDGIFGHMAQLTGNRGVEAALPLNDETFIAGPNDINLMAFDENGNPDPNYRPDSLTLMNTDGEVAAAGDTCYKYPAMAGKCVKIYTNNFNGTLTLRPLDGADDGSDDVTISVFSGMMLPMACKGIGGNLGGTGIIILA